MKNLCVLGATGSIGKSTLDVVRRHPDLYNIIAISGHSNWRLLLEQASEFKPDFVVVSDPVHAKTLEAELGHLDLDSTVLSGADSLEYIASLYTVDIVMAAIVGAAGLQANLAAARSGKRVLLANKESLVMSGALFMDAVAEGGAELLPIDSEHNAIYQCLPTSYRCGQRPSKDVSKVLLTASGGPFRSMTQVELERVSPEQACAHPNWSMGRKISVDSASLMNKGLELIEACWLFNIAPKDIEVVVHPQSIVHSMVSYIDGSVIAQMGQPDMRTPIAYGMAWPERIESGAQHLSFNSIKDLQFETPNHALFPCLGLAVEAFNKGGVAPAFLNAANEIAVDAFLKGKIRFVDIPDIIERVVANAPSTPLTDLQTVLCADDQARQLATQYLTKNRQARAI